MPLLLRNLADNDKLLVSLMSSKPTMITLHHCKQAGFKMSFN